MTTALESGTLWSAIETTTQRASRCGALHSIHTEQRFVEDGGVRFLVRAVSSLERKAQEKLVCAAKTKTGGKPFNPFLPPEPALTVGTVSDSHLAILNKFNVLDHHLLIVTRRFEHQDCPLSGADFEALWRCMDEFNGLGFYNGGRIAGASQPHKHLQMVPLPLVAGEEELPITPLLESVAWDRPLMEIPGLPFPHLFAPLDTRPDDPASIATRTLSLYEQMLSRLGLEITTEETGEARVTTPYNLLVTRRWMLLAPRATEFFQGISVNSLGFAGSLFVRNEGEMELIRREGPMKILRQVVTGGAG